MPTHITDSDAHYVRGNGEQINASTINSAILSISDGKLTIPPGTYEFDGDIVIHRKNAGNGTQGYFTLDATGARFTGEGRIIIDSCKRVSVIGLDAPNFDLLWRGCWWSSFEDMRFRKLIMGDEPGDRFSSTSWNRITGGQSQGVVLHSNAASYYNAVEWYNHSIRGDATQGFSETSQYAFEFLGNRNAQAWTFNGGDISYQTEGIYTIGPLNTIGDVELMLRSVYLDSVWPINQARHSTNIRTDNCHHANAHGFSQSMSSALSESVDMHRDDRTFKHSGSSGINLIPNGDMRDILSEWVGQNLPIYSTSGGVVTPKKGGLNGQYLNINNSNTSNNICYFRSSAIPIPSRVTGSIAIRNADEGSRSIQVGIAGLYTQPNISDTEWTFVTLTNNNILPRDTGVNVLINTIDGTPYNIDVAYVSLAMGIGEKVLMPSLRNRTIDSSFSWNPGVIEQGKYASYDVSIDDAIHGDFVNVSSSIPLGEFIVSSSVDKPGQVKVRLVNISESSQELTDAVWHVRVHKRGYD